MELSIAEDFSRFPAGIFPIDGKYCAEAFRSKLLVPLLKKGKVRLDMNGTMGFASSWLEEVFSQLKSDGLSRDEVENNLTLISDDASITMESWGYIDKSFE